MTNIRTFGWVQDSGKVEYLKRIIQAMIRETNFNKFLVNTLMNKYIPKRFNRDEMIEILQSKELPKIPYSLLKGKGNSCQLTKEENMQMFGMSASEASDVVNKGGRGNAACSGIAQICLTGQKNMPNSEKKPYQGDWQADCFLRWAISLGLLEYDYIEDTCIVSDKGKEYALTEDGSDEEKRILGEIYLSYPPVVRILSLLKNGDHLTKFELGKQLGFVGEAGFTSVPQNIHVASYCEAKTTNEKKQIKSDDEGSSDKYARMISGWLCDIGWIIRSPKKVTEKYAGREYNMSIGQAYTITREGLQNLKRAYGISKSRKIPKIVLYEMLATKAGDRDYVRNRRANIIKYLATKHRTISEVKEYLKSKNIDETPSCISDDIFGLECIGITIDCKRDSYKITDDIIKLNIPLVAVEKTDISIIKNNVREKLKHINHKYLNLIDLSFGGNQTDRDFEIQTIDLLTNELNFKGMRLGDTRKPDGIIYYNKNGVIIDNKAYSKGYSLPIKQADEMARYIEENQKRDEKINSNKWWDNFDDEVDKFNFLFISSFFTGNFEDRLKNISARLKIDGGAINSENLLYLAEKLKSNTMEYDEIFDLFNNKEVVVN